MTAPGLAARDLETPAGMARHQLRAMGTTVSVLVPTAQLELAGEVDALFTEWEETLSRFLPGSELSRLNAVAGREVLVGDLLFQVTATALEAASATDGLFDPTLLRPLIEAGYDRSFELVPPDRAAEAGLAGPGTGPVDRVGAAPMRTASSASTRSSWRDVRLDPLARSITIPEGTGLDLGGIAKGMAVDAALARLADAGVPLAAVEAGGDLAVHGSPPGGWPIAVETGDTITTVVIDGGALATSTIARRQWRVGGEIRHHLIDPRTGLPARTDALSVTVAAGTCREAEVAAKCALILGVEAGSRFLDGLALSALITTTPGEIQRAGPWASGRDRLSASAAVTP